MQYEEAKRSKREYLMNIEQYKNVKVLHAWLKDKSLAISKDELKELFAAKFSDGTPLLLVLLHEQNIKFTVQRLEELTAEDRKEVLQVITADTLCHRLSLTTYDEENQCDISYKPISKENGYIYIAYDSIDDIPYYKYVEGLENTIKKIEGKVKEGGRYFYKCPFTCKPIRKVVPLARLSPELLRSIEEQKDSYESKDGYDSKDGLAEIDKPKKIILKNLNGWREVLRGEINEMPFFSASVLELKNTKLQQALSAECQGMSMLDSIARSHNSNSLEILWEIITNNQDIMAKIDPRVLFTPPQPGATDSLGVASLFFYLASPNKVKLLEKIFEKNPTHIQVMLPEMISYNVSYYLDDRSKIKISMLDLLSQTNEGCLLLAKMLKVKPEIAQRITANDIFYNLYSGDFSPFMRFIQIKEGHQVLRRVSENNRQIIKDITKEMFFDPSGADEKLLYCYLLSRSLDGQYILKLIFDNHPEFIRLISPEMLHLKTRQYSDNESAAAWLAQYDDGREVFRRIVEGRPEFLEQMSDIRLLQYADHCWRKHPQFAIELLEKVDDNLKHKQLVFEQKYFILSMIAERENFDLKKCMKIYQEIEKVPDQRKYRDFINYTKRKFKGKYGYDMPCRQRQSLVMNLAREQQILLERQAIAQAGNPAADSQSGRSLMSGEAKQAYPDTVLEENGVNQSIRSSCDQAQGFFSGLQGDASMRGEDGRIADPAIACDEIYEEEASYHYNGM